MNYTLSKQQFDETFLNSSGKIKHTPSVRFKLFPFVGNNNAPPIDLKKAVGRFISSLEGLQQVDIDISTIIDTIVEHTKTKTTDEAQFREIIKQIFFQNNQVRPLNLRLMSKIACTDSTDKKIADYLVDVLGAKANITQTVRLAEQQLGKSSNVFEQLILSNLEAKEESDEDSSGYLPYFRIIDYFKTVFEEDFKYILGDQNRIREYLIPLLEFYFFSYTAQTCMELNRFTDGKRDHVTPLYFCLDWEKTSQSRLCFKEGWQMLLPSIRTMFAHAITLEILNQTEPGSACVDYIQLKDITLESDAKDKDIADQIDMITEYYRQQISDCSDMPDPASKADSTDPDRCPSSIRFLFRSVKTQFENTQRNRVCIAYSDKFERFCRKFLKNRGRSGPMLNISEEQLLFLTKISIKDQKQMRLKEVFKKFQERGVYLDDLSKDQVADYYEKLNLIEKKSDSGDAKYVKRVL